MDLKRLTRGPLIWVIAAMAVVFIGLRIFAPGQYQTVDTSTAIQLIKDGQVNKATMINGEQRLELKLKSPYEKKYTDVVTHYVDVPVLDETGLEGYYGFTVSMDHWKPGTVYPAFEKLGLKLVKTKRPVHVIRILKAEPTPAAD